MLECKQPSQRGTTITVTFKQLRSFRKTGPSHYPSSTSTSPGTSLYPHSGYGKCWEKVSSREVGKQSAESLIQRWLMQPWRPSERKLEQQCRRGRQYPQINPQQKLPTKDGSSSDETMVSLGVSARSILCNQVKKSSWLWTATNTPRSPRGGLMVPWGWPRRLQTVTEEPSCKFCHKVGMDACGRQRSLGEGSASSGLGDNTQ